MLWSAYLSFQLALLKRSWSFLGEEHEVVGDDAQKEFAGLRSRLAGGQGWIEAALMLAEAALDMPTLVVEGFWETMAHGPPIGRFGPVPPCVAAAEADQRAGNAQLLAAEAVVVLGVVAGIAEHSVQRDVLGGLTHGGDEVGRVLAGAKARHGCKDEVGLGMQDDGELGPEALAMAFALSPLASPMADVGADVPRFQCGRINRGHGRGIHQAKGAGSFDSRRLDVTESPFLSAPARMRREA